MEKMDLAALRECKLKIKTQQEFAQFLEVDEKSVKHWESEPSDIPYEVIFTIARKTGLSLEEITGFSRPKVEPLQVDNSWFKADFTRRNLGDYIEAGLQKMSIPQDQYDAYIARLRAGINESVVKPKIAIVGRSDTGKSTLINTLLGVEGMPTAWTPTTSIAVYIKHVSDRPDFIQDDAWIFASELDGEQLWNERRLQDEEYCNRWKIAGGGIDLLRSYGTRQGEHHEVTAGSAVIFVDSPVLNTCDIIDLPGFGTQRESDDDITFSVTQSAQIVIYLSQANGFMRIEDIAYLQRNIATLPIWECKDANTLKPLANLFVVASQAHTVNHGNREDLKTILDVGCQELEETLPDGYWKDRMDISGYLYEDNGHKELRDRFFTYTTDIPELCEVFNSQLKEVIETLPLIIDARTKEFVRQYVRERKPNLEHEIEKYEGIIADREKYERLLREIEENELKRRQDNNKRREKILESIESSRVELLEDFGDYIAKTINTEALVEQMKAAQVKNKKEDIERFVLKLQNQIQYTCNEHLKERTKMIGQSVEKYVADYADSISSCAERGAVKADFNASWAFASALTKIVGASAVIGGTGACIASFATAMSIVTSSTWLLSAGAGMQGIAGALSIMSVSPLAPIGVAVGLALVASMGAVKLFGGGWEKSVAKKIVSQFDEQDVELQYQNAINNFFDQVKDGFWSASSEMEKDFQSYVEDLREIVHSTDVETLENKIMSLKNLTLFFDNIPL